MIKFKEVEVTNLLSYRCNIVYNTVVVNLNHHRVLNIKLMAAPFRRPTILPTGDIHRFIHDPKERIWNGSFTFVVLADPQFGMIGSYNMHLDSPVWDKEVQLATKAVNEINIMDPKPKFVVLCGDMLDAFPFEKAPQYYTNSEVSDIELRKHQYDSFVEVFRHLDPAIRLIFCVGNHDVGDHPTKESMQFYHKQFESLPKEMQEQDKFIDTIKDPTAKFLVVFQHIPYFTKDPNEEDSWRNIGQKIRLPVLDRLVDAGVKYVFCGHCHESFNVMYKNLEIVVSSALGAPMGTTPSGYCIVHVTETGLKHTYVQLCDSTEFTENKTDKKCSCCCNKCNIVY